ncbi:MAG: hypothetical protein KBS65_05645 [Prevotella sp.]|nr:hypothetical protein [Candidatus Equicola stercoris]
MTHILTSGDAHPHVRLHAFPRQVARIATSGCTHPHIRLCTSSCQVGGVMKCGVL